MLTLLALIASAGTAGVALGQPAATPSPRVTADASRNTADFRSSDWLRDRKVTNNNGEEIAVVSDLILDRGSGRIEYIIIKTGSTFGLGGRAVAVAYSAFRWDSAGEDRFVLSSTPEQLKLHPEYTAESWKSMKEFDRDDKNAMRKHLSVDATATGDPYAGSLDTARKVRVEGEVIRVERTRSGSFGEQIVVSVQASNGTVSKVALGPSWYVNGAAAAPMRGDKVVIDTVAMPRDPNNLMAAYELRRSERVLKLRDAEGRPLWALKAVESEGRSYSTPYSRYMVVSDLPGMKIDCRGSECGKVHDIIIDRKSGELAFISVDPNQNFLGISDTKRLIPWSVATVTIEGTMRIDATKDMVLASPQTPAEITELNRGVQAEGVYKAFDVPVPQFEPSAPTAAMGAEDTNPWGSRGAIISRIEPGSDKTMSGKVVEVFDVKFDGGVQSARAVKVRLGTGETSDEVIVLGPLSYMDNQKPLCRAGDSVKIDACRTTIGGHKHWMARRIECGPASTTLVEAGNAPVWSQR
jgi:sporulation protein YlmC with PRC-barrel domain